MQTLTLAKARKNLGGWLRKALAGQEIGVVVGGKIVALRPIHDVPADYAEREYGMTTAEVDRAAQRIRRSTAAAAARGNTVAFAPGMLADANRAHKALPLRRKKAVR